MSFDIVIPVGPNDDKFIFKQIEFTKKNVLGYRNIYLICSDPTLIVDDCITINESIFPFSINTVAEFHGKNPRNGWYLQQLLKLYSSNCIPDILDRYLAIDSDTCFLKPTTFIDEDDKCLYNWGTEYHRPYFEHMLKLNKDFTKVYPDKSGICHHMLFETKYVNEIISKIETEHDDTFYNIFLKMVTTPLFSGASEYEIYFNYMVKNHPDKIKLRFLSCINSDKKSRAQQRTIASLLKENKLDYISEHYYLR